MNGAVELRVTIEADQSVLNTYRLLALADRLEHAATARQVQVRVILSRARLAAMTGVGVQ